MPAMSMSRVEMTRGEYKNLAWIDTQGLNDSRGERTADFEKTVDFVRTLPSVHATVITLPVTINVWTDQTQKMFERLNSFFNDASHWDNVAIVLTGAGLPIELTVEQLMRSKQEKVALLRPEVDKTLQRIVGRTAPVAFFCIDSHSPTGLNEIAILKVWINGRQPRGTASLQVPDVFFCSFRTEGRWAESGKRVYVGKKEVDDGKYVWAGDLGAIFGWKKWRADWKTIEEYREIETHWRWESRARKLRYLSEGGGEEVTDWEPTGERKTTTEKTVLDAGKWKDERNHRRELYG
jgi:hypothetical protein